MTLNKSKETISIEECQKILEARVQEDMEDEEETSNLSIGRVLTSDIKYYNFRRRRHPALVKHMRALEKEGVSVDTHRDIDITMRVGRNEDQVSTSMSMWNVGYTQLMNFAERELSDKKSGKLDFMREIHENPHKLDLEEAMRWFNEKDELSFSEFNSDLFEDDTYLFLGKNEKILDQTIDEYWDEIQSNEQISDYAKFKRGLALDMVKTLQGMALNKEDDSGFLDTVSNFESFFRNYQPELYGTIPKNDDSYTIHPVTDRQENIAASINVGSCLAHKDYTESHWMYEKDPFTFIQAVGRNEKIKGYVRSFILEDSEGSNFLGIDTIEVPKSGGINLEDARDDFEENEDILKAGALGAIKLATSLNLDYVAAKDARIRFGLRQAYSNTSRDIQYQKLGDTVPYYSTVGLEYDEKSESVIPPDQGFEGETSKKGFPGFAHFHYPGDQDVRGFQTEPGWHEHEAYILFQNPNNF